MILRLALGRVNNDPVASQLHMSFMIGSMIRESWANARDRRQLRRAARSRNRDRSCDGCDSCNCCDLGLFSTMLTIGALAATATRAPVLDRAGLAAIGGYRRWLSPYWPGRCRFTPTCSAYGLAAVQTHGLGTGGRLAASRLRRCRPTVPQGTADPVTPAAR